MQKKKLTSFPYETTYNYVFNFIQNHIRITHEDVSNEV